MSVKKVVACIKRNKNFLITSHTNLEGDALGSELAFYRLLKKLGKRATIVNQDGLPYGYDFLPGKNIIRRLKEMTASQMRFDCLAVLDCSDLGRTGEVYKLPSGHRTTLNIDHHISNRRFGNVNWVEPGYSSCCEMIYRLYKELRIGFDRETALFLYVGLLTDTGSFRYSNTTARVHEAVAELLQFHLDVSQIYRCVYKNMSFQDIKLLANILSGIKVGERGRLAWAQVRKSLLLKRKVSFDLSEEILSLMRAMKDVEVCVLFKENLKTKDQIRVNFRSQGKADVNKIAAYFGGGGHKTASGATLHGSLSTATKEVLAKVKKSFK
ncbi:MAG: bifunctional oligoribonuclease/PAP phosphatase NrnA [Candidatus Omnitrophota bacterium]